MNLQLISKTLPKSKKKKIKTVKTNNMGQKTEEDENNN